MTDTQHRTASTSVQLHPSRRAVVAGAASSTLAALPVIVAFPGRAGAVGTPDPVLPLVARYRAQIGAMGAVSDHLDEPTWEAAQERRMELFDRIMDTPASTPAGQAAKLELIVEMFQPEGAELIQRIATDLRGAPPAAA